jgi:hypothetical protein
MYNVQVMDCTEPAKIKLEKVRFFNRQLLTAEDMITERDYFLQKLRRHNRFLHGWGVVCGLTVTAAPTDGANWRVQVGSGYALGPYGDEIFVGEPVYFDLAACATSGATNPCEPGMIVPGTAGSSMTVYLAIQYAECLARPIQVAPSGCGCDAEPCQYSRIRDSFQIQCLQQLPQQPPPVTVTLCQVVRAGVPAPCPPCPTNPWVVLAQIDLPMLSTMKINDFNIHNNVRRVILSTAVLQDQLVRCCCGPASPNLLVSQQAVPIRNGGTEENVTVTVENKATVAAENVVVTVNLTPLASAGYDVLIPNPNTWQKDNPQQLHLEIGTIQANKPPFSSPNFFVVPTKHGPMSITSTASVTSTTAGVLGSQNVIMFQIT